MFKDSIEVLVVDDDQDDFENTERLLRRGRHALMRASWEPDFSQALHKLLSGSYHVCLLDYWLGAKTGIDFLKEARKKGCRVPIILLTGRGDDSVDLAAMEAGGSDYLIKDDLNTASLERAIRYSVTHARLLETISMNSKLSALGEMASAIVHEINAPLTHMLAMIQLARKQSVTHCSSSTLIAQTLDALRSATIRMDRTIKSVQALSSGSITGPVERVPAKALVDEVVDLCRPRLMEKSVDIKIDVDPGLFIECRPAEISQVLFNLLRNAVDAVEPLEERWINLKVKQLDAAIELTVTDSGSNLPQQVRERMLEPFFTTKPAGKGTGLGLTISKKLIEAHGGQLELDSQSVNTCLRIRLPRSEDRAA